MRSESMARFVLLSALAVLARTAAASAAALHCNEHYASEFALWTNQYNVVFEDEAEYNARLQIFAANRWGFLCAYV